jgi:hypothetical protein
VERLAAKAIVLYHRSDYAFVPMCLSGARQRASRGDVIGAHETIEDWEHTGAAAPLHAPTTVDALLGDEGGASPQARPFLATAMVGEPLHDRVDRL